SPHAPYTVSEPLYRATAELARRERLPVAVHLAESREETALVRDGAGPFADGLRARGIPVPAHNCTPVQYLSRLGVLQRATGWLCIHCVQVDGPDIESLRNAGAAVALCPRSNRAHGHGTAPLPLFRRAGLAVGFGTDSVVSTGDVDLWSEAGAAGLEGSEALRMLTLDGARALGLDAEIGSLDVGKQADLAVFASTALRPAPGKRARHPASPRSGPAGDARVHGGGGAVARGQDAGGGRAGARPRHRRGRVGGDHRDHRGGRRDPRHHQERARQAGRAEPPQGAGGPSRVTLLPMPAAGTGFAAQPSPNPGRIVALTPIPPKPDERRST